jgi:hypothetical protein
MDVYQSHAHICHRCADSRFQDSLCEQGTLLARNVRKYLYKKSGKFFARVGHEYNRTNQVDIPQNAYSVRSLLAAMERGSQPCHSVTSPQYPIEIIERRPRHCEDSDHTIQFPSLTGTKHIYLKKILYKERFLHIVRGVDIKVGRAARRSAVHVAINILR